MLTILQGDWIEQLASVPAESVQTCVTSPPYWGLRNYGVSGQLGQERTPDEYVQKIVEGFREVRRVLKNDGTLWLNLGDSYNGSGKARGGGGAGPSSRKQRTNGGAYFQSDNPINADCCKPKDLIGIPWMVAFALRNDDWYLRCDIIWSKPNPMPESVTDRPTRAHEYIFLLSKNRSYYYDYEAIKETGTGQTGLAMSFCRETKESLIPGQSEKQHRLNRPDKQNGHSRKHAGFNDRWDQMEKNGQCDNLRNKRSVWTVPPANYDEAHFATFPPNLIKPCILAGSRPSDTVLDPFGGSGTTGKVALENGRKALLIELNPDYVQLIKKRCIVQLPLLLH